MTSFEMKFFIINSQWKHGKTTQTNRPHLGLKVADSHFAKKESAPFTSQGDETSLH